MRLTWLLLLFLIVTAALAKGKSKRKDRTRGKRVHRGQQDEGLALEEEVDVDDDDEEYETIEVTQEGGQEEERRNLQNPCNLHKCRRGEICVLEDRTPKCECQTCEPKQDRDTAVKVCSTKNVTYESECELDRDHCLCKMGDAGCRDPQEDRVRLDYYSACKELTECPQEELENFPNRMRDWLFRVMTDMAMRGYEEMDEYRDLLENARQDEMHADAVIWKFCDLDIHPEDRHVSRRELMYIIASVKPMEHCLVPFLNNCDDDDDGTITLVEWGTCLKIGHEAIVDKCKPISNIG